MQLIFETENTNVNISLKMSTVDEGTLTEKPLPNGGIKEILEEVNEKLEANGTGNGENFQNKENVLNNGEVENHKKSEDITVSAEKPSDETTVREETREAGDIMPVDKSIVGCPSETETKEVGDNSPAQKILEECRPVDDIIQSGNNISVDITMKKCLSEEKPQETNHVTSAERAQDNEIEKSSYVASAEISEDGIDGSLGEDNTLSNEANRKSEQLDQGPVEKMEIAKQQPTEEDNEDHQKSEPLDQEPVKQVELAKQQPTDEANEDHRKSEPLDQEPVEQVELTKQQPTDEANEDHRKSEPLDQEPMEQVELANQQPTVQESDGNQKSEPLDQEPMEQVELAKQQPTEQENEDHRKSEPLDQEPMEQVELAKQLPTEAESEDCRKSELLEQEPMKQIELTKQQSTKEENEDNRKSEQLDQESEELMAGIAKQPTEKEMSQLETKKEMSQSDIKEMESDENKKPTETDDANPDLDKPLQKLCEDTSSETKLDSLPSENTKEVEYNIFQNTDNVKNVTDNVDLANSDKDKVESMEVDENDGISIEKDIENISENDITQSISDMVGNIVQSLNDDTADDFMEDIEIDNNEKVEPIISAKSSKQDIAEDSTIDKITDKAETENVEEIVKDVSEQTTPQTEEQDEMDIDEDPKENSDDIIKTTLTSNQASPVNTKKNETFQTLSEKTDTILSESNNVDNKKEYKVAGINSDINLPSSVDNAVEVSTDKIAQNDTSVDTYKENEKVIMETDVSEVIKLKSGHSTSNMDDVDSSISKMEDEIISLISNNIGKEPDSTTNKDDTLTPEKQTQVAKTKEDASDIDEVNLSEEKQQNSEQKDLNEKTPEKVPEKNHTPFIKLSNTMDILSDEEDEPSPAKASTSEANNESQKPKAGESPEKQCINLVDDDDIMVIDEDTKDDKKDISQAEPSIEKVDESQTKNNDEIDFKDDENKTLDVPADVQKDSTKTETHVKADPAPQPEVEKPVEAVPEKQEKSRPFIPPDFFKTYRKNLADMTRDDLEEFCILKIVESIIDRSNLNDIRSKLKSMSLTIEEYKKKAMMISKQNRDLQVVLKSVQEEQKKATGNQPITPLKITRSVGMQVLMTDKNRRRVMPGPGGSGPSNTNTNQVNNRNVRTPNQSPRNTPQKQGNNQAIPVPRLVPAGINSAKPTQVNQANNNAKATAVQNGVKNSPPAQKPEKRTHSRMQSQSTSVTVDLTDDEPPPKVATKTSPAPPVRLVNPQNLLAPRQQFPQQVNSPRKVYIPISINGPQGQHTRPGQTLMLKTVGQGPRPRGPGPTIVRTPQSTVPVRKVGTRHPAPLPDAMKQYQPPNWKALPPAPDLKLSKVENGIVISWKIEGYQEDSYEDIASYQLYAYQETSAPPSTSLWKKIGDVKALPLPMACTLTQFMAGYKYYFAVRAVDIRSRLGPFSLPGSILLLNKM